MSFSSMSLDDLTKEEAQLADMEEELQAVADRIANYRTGLTIEIAKRVTAST
jgi:hypothetical protein